MRSLLKEEGESRKVSLLYEELCGKFVDNNKLTNRTVLHVCCIARLCISRLSLYVYRELWFRRGHSINSIQLIQSINQSISIRTSHTLIFNR